MQTKTKIKKVPKEAGQFSFSGKACFEQPKDEEGARATFKFIPYKGQIFSHPWWGQLAFDIDGMEMRKEVIPALKNHEWDQMVGEITSMKKSENEVSFEGEFLDNDDAKSIQSTEKLEWECSLAFDLGSAELEEVTPDEEVEVNGQKMSNFGTIVRACQIHEVSFTHFGAVPDTNSSFENSTQEFEVTVSYKEDNSMEVDEALQKGQDSARSQLKSMNELCSDSEFVMECFSKGTDLAEFKEMLLDKAKVELSAKDEEIVALKAEVSELKEKLEAAPAEQTTFSAASEGTEATEEEPDNYLDYAKFVAKRDSIELSKAYGVANKEKPELAAAYRESQVRK